MSQSENTHQPPEKELREAADRLWELQSICRLMEGGYSDDVSNLTELDLQNIAKTLRRLSIPAVEALCALF